MGVWGALPGSAEREALNFAELVPWTTFQIRPQYWAIATNGAKQLPPKVLGVAEFSLQDEVLSVPPVKGWKRADLVLPLIVELGDESCPDNESVLVSGTIGLTV